MAYDTLTFYLFSPHLPNSYTFSTTPYPMGKDDYVATVLARTDVPNELRPYYEKFGELRDLSLIHI